MNAQVAQPPSRWGTRIEIGTVNGHPCRQYAERPHSLAELLVDAQRWAERELVIQGERRLTGSAHAKTVACIAHALRERGVQRGDAVLLLGFNHIEWLASFWALQCLGAVAVLGNAWWSPDEAAHAVEQVRPRLVLSDFPVRGASPLAFEELRALVATAGHAELPLQAVTEEDDAVVIFSSGTTGQAKGVVMSHRSVIANIHNLMRLTGRLPSELLPTHEGTVSLVSMPLFHLAGIQIALMTMLSGGKLVFLEGKFDSLRVLQLIEREKVRSWGSVPTMVSRVIQHERFSEFDTSSVSSVQMGGAAVPHELREKVEVCFPKAKRRVGTMYGLTEAGGVLAAGSGEEVAGRPGCVGRALPSVEVRIDRPNAEGVGEIVARTPSATTGYLGESIAIADAEGWVLSGDLGRFDEDGLLYVVGRSKDMIIRGGENIASVHVERCLRTHPAVLEVAVVPLPHADLGEEVGAAVVLRSGAQLTSEELRAHVSTSLARFEVPSKWWISRDPLPTNASGKVIKREVIARWPDTGAQS